MHANVLGTDIFYETAGEGEPILFCHGLGGTGNVWGAQRQAFSKFYQVITLDLPGSGRSGRHETDYNMERWADQIAGLADALKLDRFVLVGHSMSTILAQKCAAKYPRRLRGLVLCGPLTELPDVGKEAFTKRSAMVIKDGMLSVVDTVLSGALTAATREGNAVLAGLFREMLLSNDAKTYAAQIQALIKGSAKQDQPKVECPTLIVVGDQDSVTPLSNCRAIASAIPNALIRVIPATAHLTMAERPELFNSALQDFLATL